MSKQPHIDISSPKAQELMSFLVERLKKDGANAPLAEESAAHIVKILLGQIEWFYRGPKGVPEQYTQEEKRSLLSLAQQAQNLLVGMNSLNLAARSEVTSSIPSLIPGPSTMGTSAFHALPGVLENFVAEIETVTSESIKSGPKTSPQVKDFVWMLAGIWQEATDKLPPRTRTGDSVGEGKKPFALALCQLIKKLDEGKAYSEAFVEGTIVGQIAKYREAWIKYLKNNPNAD